jgi:translation initiation factor 3 subunit K
MLPQRFLAEMLTPNAPRCAQIQNSAYDFDANLAILKLYQFYPQTTNMEVRAHAAAPPRVACLLPAFLALTRQRYRTQVVAKILAKALMAIPGTDFLLCTYLISEQIKVDAAVEALYNLSGLLEQAEFKTFWETYPSSAAAPLLAAIPDFEEKIGDVSLPMRLARTDVPLWVCVYWPDP